MQKLTLYDRAGTWDNFPGLYTAPNLIVSHSYFWDHCDEIIPDGYIAYDYENHHLVKGDGTKRWRDYFCASSDRLYKEIDAYDAKDAGDVIRDYFYKRTPDGQIVQKRSYELDDLEKTLHHNDIFIVNTTDPKNYGRVDNIYRFDRDESKWILMHGHEDSAREIKYEGGINETTGGSFLAGCIIVIILGLILMWTFDNFPELGGVVFIFAVIGFFFIRPLTK